MDHKILFEVLEYLAVVAAAVLISLAVSDVIATPLWGGLSNAPLR